MSIRVVKRGTVPSVVFRGTCHRCRSEIEADPEDVKRDTPPYPEPYSLPYVTCPVCDTHMAVFRHDIPPTESTS